MVGRPTDLNLDRGLFYSRIFSRQFLLTLPNKKLNLSPPCWLLSLAHQRPCLMSLLRGLLSLARQRPPLPAIVITAGSRPLPSSVRPRLPWSSPVALIPCPSASALACHHHCRHRHQQQRTCPADFCRPRCPCCPTAALAIPSTSVVQPRHNHCCHQALFATAVATNLMLFGQCTFSHTEELVTSKLKTKSVIYYLWHNF